GSMAHPTIAPRLQVAARKAIVGTLYSRNDPASALVSIDPSTGAIGAMTAVTPRSSGNQFNPVAQPKRQAGSTFKMFVLAAAVNEGINPQTTYYVSAPFHYQPDPYSPAWNVTTYDHTYLGSTSIENATLHSDNTVYAQLTLDVGPAKVAAMARVRGVRSPLTTKGGAYVPSLGLGAIPVSPLDLASAYATLAAGGIYSKPMAIRKVVLGNGKEDTGAGWGEPDRKRAISPGVAYTVTRILERNMQYGTGTGAYYGRPSAGKTGTTDNYADAWFCGYTPNLEATVWIGYPRGEIPMRSVHGIAVSGPTFPATIWKSYMRRAVGRTQALDFKEPSVLATWHPFTRGQYAIGGVRPPPPTHHSNKRNYGPERRRRPRRGADARRGRSLHRLSLAGRLAGRAPERRAPRRQFEVGMALPRRRDRRVRGLHRRAAPSTATRCAASSGRHARRGDSTRAPRRAAADFERRVDLLELWADRGRPPR